MADEIEDQDSPKPGDEDVEKPEGDEEKPGDGEEETPEAKAERLERENEELKSQKDQLHGRAKRAEEELKRRAPAAKPGAVQPGLSKETADRIEEKVDLRLAGYSKEEIGEIEAYAKAKGIGSLSEAAKAPFIQHAINGMRAEAKAKEATPSSGKRGTPGKEAAKMTPKERAAAGNFETWRQNRRRSGNR